MGPAIRLLAVLRATATFAAKRPKDAAIVVLVILAAVLAWRARRTEARAREFAARLEGLPPDTKQVVTVYRDRIRVVTRDGPTRVEYRESYVPPEGGVEVVTKVDEPEGPPQVAVKDWGFTSRMGGGVIYAGEALPLVDLKWAYWRRYSLTVGLTPRFGGLGFSRHIDDVTPFGNLEFLGMAGVGWSGDPRFGLGFRTNF